MPQIGGQSAGTRIGMQRARAVLMPVQRACAMTTFAVDLVLTGSIALVAGGMALVAPWEVGLAAACAACLLVCPVAARGWPATARGWQGPARVEGRGGLCVVLTIALGIGLGALRGRAAVSRHEEERRRADVALGAPLRCTARGRVDSSPVRVRDVLRWDARLVDLVCEGRRSDWEGEATLYGGPEDLARGDEAEVVATLGAPQRLWNSATGDPRPAEAHRGIARSGGVLDVRVAHRAVGLRPAIDRARARVRARIEETFPRDIAPMARALVLGESDLSPDDDRAFRASGLSHLLAVSGMHLVLVLALAVKTLESILVRCEGLAGRCDVGRAAAGIGVPIAWVYAEFAGGGGSTVRAAWMATVALAARALGRRTDAARAFGLSMGLMALADPLVAFDLSFLLSAGATGGLLAFASPLAHWLAARLPRRAGGVARAAATTVAASIPCVPILARFAPTVPLGGVVANLVAVPLGECAALPLCLAHALVPWWPSAERGCALAASGALGMVRRVARAFASSALTMDVPQPTSWQLTALTIAVAATLLLRRRAAPIVTLCVAAVLLLEVGARREGAPRGVLRATFLDVGQGDSAIVDLPDGEALLIDGGGLVGSPIDVGERVLAPELRARRRGALAAVVLTHPHPDHFGGLVTGLGAVRVGAFWDSGEGESEGVGGGYGTLLQAMRERVARVLRPGQLCGAHELGGASVEVLAPCPTFSPDRSANDNSLVLRIAFGRRAVLFVGDTENEQEDTLLRRARDRLRADVLKVGHHGSRTSSSPAFVAAVAPREAVISTGCRNRFGHPHPSTLATLSAAGARVWRTDRDGAVVVTTDGEKLEARSVGGRSQDAH
jgi:competence protein ComEC